MLTLLAVVAMLGTPASAAVSVFTWGNVASDWGAAANWSPAGPPTGFSAVAQFTSASYTFQPQLVSASQSLGGIWDNGAGPVNISANSNFALSLAGTTINGRNDTGLELDAGAGALTINCPVTMSAVQIWNNFSANPITVNNTVNWGAVNNAMLNTSGSGGPVIAGSLGNIGTGNNYLGGVTITGTVAWQGSVHRLRQHDSERNHLGSPRRNDEYHSRRVEPGDLQLSRRQRRHDTERRHHN